MLHDCLFVKSTTNSNKQTSKQAKKQTNTNICTRTCICIYVNVNVEIVSCYCCYCCWCKLLAKMIHVLYTFGNWVTVKICWPETLYCVAGGGNNLQYMKKVGCECNVCATCMLSYLSSPFWFLCLLCLLVIVVNKQPDNTKLGLQLPNLISLQLLFVLSWTDWMNDWMNEWLLIDYWLIIEWILIYSVYMSTLLRMTALVCVMYMLLLANFVR